jgi:hypothetical protein
MRALVRGLLAGDPDLYSMIPTDRWYGDRAVLDTPVMPFGVIRFGGTTRSVTARSPIKVVRLEVWVYDRTGDYTRIDIALGHVKRILNSTYGVKDDLYEIVQCDWDTDSPDLYDDTYKANTRSAGFTLVGKF